MNLLRGFCLLFSWCVKDLQYSNIFTILNVFFLLIFYKNIYCVFIMYKNYHRKIYFLVSNNHTIQLFVLYMTANIYGYNIKIVYICNCYKQFCWYINGDNNTDKNHNEVKNMFVRGLVCYFRFSLFISITLTLGLYSVSYLVSTQTVCIYYLSIWFISKRS